MALLIKSIPINGLNLLGVGGQPVVRTYRQLRSVFDQVLGSEAADLFARPVLDAGSGPVDWYAPDGVPAGAIRQLRDLPAAQSEQIRADIATKLEQLRTHARQLAVSSDANQVKLADRLEKATQFPNDDFIFVIGDRPVITCWGCAAERPDRAPTDLARAHATDARTARPAGSAQDTVAPAVVATSDTSSTTTIERRIYERDVLVLPSALSWATVLAMLALFLFLGGIARSLVPACGLAWPLLPAAWSNVWCTEVVAVVDTDADEREAADLERQLAQLRNGLQAQACPPPQRVAAAPVSKPPSDIEKEIKRNDGKVGEINVTLRWKGRADLDLNVTCPSGDIIFHRITKACGGELDVDMNFNGRRSETPIENVVFPDGQAAKGTYRVGVAHSGYKEVAEGPEPVEFEIIIRIRGQEQRVTGQIEKGKQQSGAATFQVD